MFRNFLLLFFNVFILCGTSSLSSAAKSNKIEELFIWKISEELNLSPAEEKAFAAKFKELNKKKAELNLELNEKVQNVTGLKSEKEQREFLNQYKKILDSIHDLSKEEVNSFVKILGVKKTASYLQIKMDLSNKVKTLITQPQQGDKVEGGSKLPPPKVIIE